VNQIRVNRMLRELRAGPPFRLVDDFAALRRLFGAREAAVKPAGVRALEPDPAPARR
jgi:hypothetical protein